MVASSVGGSEASVYANFPIISVGSIYAGVEAVTAFAETGVTTRPWSDGPRRTGFA